MKNKVEELNDLLKGERSATETYRQALDKVGTDPKADELRVISSDHMDAVGLIKKEVVKEGGSPSDDSGAWGAWSQTVMGAAKVLGEKSSVKALKEGEEHGLKNYQRALENPQISTEFKKSIQDKFIPAQERHIRELDNILNVL